MGCLRMVAIVRESAFASCLLQFGTWRLDKIKCRLKMLWRMAHRMTFDDHSRAAISLALVIKGKFNFGAYSKWPLRQKGNALGRPVNLILNQID